MHREVGEIGRPWFSEPIREEVQASAEVERDVLVALWGTCAPSSDQPLAEATTCSVDIDGAAEAHRVQDVGMSGVARDGTPFEAIAGTL